MTSPHADGTQELCALGVRELGRLYRSRALSPVELVQATLDRIARLNPALNVYITVLAESAREAARAAERQLTSGIDLGPLHGVPVAVKDNIHVRGTRTTAASRVLEDAPLDDEDAPVVRRLRATGAILIGKTNLFEFAFGPSEADGPFGHVQNPRKVGHQSGGSSSGSAAVLAAGLAVVTLGTDTGGSTRHPASVCGIAGLNPTYGLVPIRGVIPVSVYLDRVGPLGRSVADVAAGLGAIAGYNPLDPYSVLAPGANYVGALERGVRGLRLGLPTNSFFRFGLPVAHDLLRQAHETLARLGLVPVALELPRAEETNDLANLIMAVDLCVYHQRYRERASLYLRSFVERSRPGREASAVQYAQARLAQAEIRQRWLALFEQVDLLALPANVAGAPRHGENMIEISGEQHPALLVTSRFTRGPSLAGLPALVVPIGQTPEGLPISMQLVGPPFGEERLLAVGYALEQALGNLPAVWGVEPRWG